MAVNEVLLVLLVMTTSINAEGQHCGGLLETQLYKDKAYTEQDEHPWLGRILYRDANQSTTYRCTVALLHPRHGLAPALCVNGRSNRKQTPFAVMFGGQECSFGRTFEIEEFFVPPNYTHASYELDFAVIRLKEEVPFSQHIQPICLPQSEEISPTLAGQNVEVIGFEVGSYEASSMRRKTFAHLVVHSVCQEQYNHISPHLICGFVRGAPLQQGAILAGVRIVDGEPRQYFLIGHLLAKFDSVVSGADLFMYIAPYRNWIEARINGIVESHMSLEAPT
ncbi:venom protease-like [Drosophila erecta]|nr:venom protease-like [Drosophila erecta]